MPEQGKGREQSREAHYDWGKQKLLLDHRGKTFCRGTGIACENIKVCV